jgi:hypothetical protein
MNEDEKDDPPELIPEEQMVEILRQRIDQAGSQWVLALNLHVSPTYVSMALNGRRVNCRTLYEQLGYERIVYYRKKPSVK